MVMWRLSRSYREQTHWILTTVIKRMMESNSQALVIEFPFCFFSFTLVCISGPATYNPSILSISTHPRAPSYSFKDRSIRAYLFYSREQVCPGSYNIAPLRAYKRAAPCYSFGKKHSKKQTLGPIHDRD